MSAELGPGVWMEGAKNCDAGGHAPDQIIKGRLYLCTGIVRTHGACGCCYEADGPGVRYKGEPYPDLGVWCHCHFKPIFKPKEGAFDHLIKGAPADADADAEADAVGNAFVT